MATRSSLPPGTVYYSSYNTTTKRYNSKWIDCSYSLDRVGNDPNAFRLKLALGGTICIYPNLVGKDECRSVTKEILNHHNPLTNESLLRQYSLRNTNEPRLHCLLHKLATPATATATATSGNTTSGSTTTTPSTNNVDQEQEQPGYRYGNTTLKGRSMDDLPRTRQLTNRMEKLYVKQQMFNRTKSNNSTNGTTDHTESSGMDNRDTVFNIGVEVVFYRNGNDSIGFHADNDQGESFILATILRQNQQQQPTKKQTRSIIILPIQPIKVATKTTWNNAVSTKHQLGSRDSINLLLRYKIILGEGDSYSMDGIMQNFYEHGVPKCLDSQQHTMDSNANHQRMVLVFRRGTMRNYTKDSGHPVLIKDVLRNPDISNRHRYRQGHIPGLCESNLYSRSDLKEIGAHVLDRNSISGNGMEGCTALIVSGLKHKGISYDTFHTLKHCCNFQQGAHAMYTSYLRKLPIRVFRKVNHGKEISGRFYRYDGLYNHSQYPEVEDEEKQILAFYLKKK